MKITMSVTEAQNIIKNTYEHLSCDEVEIINVPSNHSTFTREQLLFIILGCWHGANNNHGNNTNKIACIKLYREMTGDGLRESKEDVEKILCGFGVNV